MQYDSIFGNEESPRRKYKKGKLQKKEAYKKRKARLSSETLDLKSNAEVDQEQLSGKGLIPEPVLSIPITNKKEEDVKISTTVEMSKFTEKLKLKGLGLKVSLGNSSVTTTESFSKPTQSESIKTLGQKCSEIGSGRQHLFPCCEVSVSC